MNYRIIKQPNSKFALWKVSEADFVLKNVKRDDLIEYFLLFEKERIEKEVDAEMESLNVLSMGENVAIFTDALRIIAEEHTEAAPSILFYKARNIIP